MITLHKILVPTDFSESSLAGSEYARSLATVYDGTIYVLHVVNEPSLAAPYPSIDPNAENILQDIQEKAREKLQHIVATTFPDKPNIRMIVRHGNPAKEIVKFAHQEGIDLIVMATHGRTGLAHVLMGSVAEEVVRHSTIPVLTLHPVRGTEQPTTIKGTAEQAGSCSVKR